LYRHGPVSTVTVADAIIMITDDQIMAPGSDSDLDSDLPESKSGRSWPLLVRPYCRRPALPVSLRLPVPGRAVRHCQCCSNGLVMVTVA
jgi:hypothetical protein